MLIDLILHLCGDIGLGLGAILCQASAVTDGMVDASSLGLADSLTSDERSHDLLYPRLERIREISAYIAFRVIRKAQEEVRACFYFSPFPGFAYKFLPYITFGIRYLFGTGGGTILTSRHNQRNFIVH